MTKTLKSNVVFLMFWFSQSLSFPWLFVWYLKYRNTNVCHECEFLVVLMCADSYSVYLFQMTRTTWQSGCPAMWRRRRKQTWPVNPGMWGGGSPHGCLRWGRVGCGDWKWGCWMRWFAFELKVNVWQGREVNLGMPRSESQYGV